MGSLPADPAFSCLVDFGVLMKDCMNQVRYLLSMGCTLLGYSFEPGLIAVHLVQQAQLSPSAYQ